MKERHRFILNKVRLQYPDVNFDIIEDHKSIQLVYDDISLVHNEVFFDFACDTAYDNLVGEELNVFSLVHESKC